MKRLLNTAIAVLTLLLSGCATEDRIMRIRSLATMSDPRVQSQVKDAPARKALVRALGFDVVDARAQFAPPLIPGFGGLIDPGRAHSGQFRSRAVTAVLLCGASDGKASEAACARR